MVALSYLAVAAAAVSGAFAAPAANAASDPPDFEFGPHNLARRQDYNQNYKTGGSVNFSPGSNGYSVSFSGAGDFVVGKGWKKGTDRYVCLVTHLVSP
jgi:endo-1,4-beta-xylanase